MILDWFEKCRNKIWALYHGFKFTFCKKLGANVDKMFYVEIGASYENGCFETRVGVYFKIPKCVVEVEPS